MYVYITCKKIYINLYCMHVHYHAYRYKWQVQFVELFMQYITHNLYMYNNPSIILEAGVSAGSAAKAAELRKHSKYDVKCSELGWRCTPLAVETYGAWGAEACNTFSFIASRVAIMTNKSKSIILSNLYGKLSIILVRSNARAIMLRSLMPAAGGFSENF